MSDLKQSPPVVVIGDLVGSRVVADRAGLHHVLAGALSAVNDRWGTDLRITVGDEFQGTVPSLGAATSITLALRLALLPDHDLRCGIGRGATAVLDATSGIEDGPGWWAARAAIEAVEALADRPATRGARTAYRSTDVTEPVGALDAALLARDELVGRLSSRSSSVLRGLLSGRTQREVAADEQVSESAVSQRVRRDGIGVVVTMSEWLESLE
ncbi:SatD family protein [Nocardioides rubriscoriae]|uniref:SatD family protein n=1 Tax=Nocardioides rubriscoriae TaxID=642762 RepID=UPI0011DF43A9|nr:SatD family protein [Nocardioides rubriscoriae]